MRRRLKLTINLLVLGILHGAASSTASAATVTLDNDKWALLVVPADPMSSSIRTIFGSGLPQEQYGESWTVFFFDSIAGSYVNPGLDDALQPGQAFWTIQATGSPVKLDLAKSLSDSNASPSAVCEDNQSCVAIPLQSSDSDVTWNLTGVPLSAPTETDEVLFVSNKDGNDCSNGCSLDEASSKGLFTGPLWVYNSDEETYSDAATGVGVIAPGVGFWAATTKPAADSSPALHLPAARFLASDKAENVVVSADSNGDTSGNSASRNCNAYASPNGSDNANGSSTATPQSLNAATGALEAGDTLCLMPGTYPAPIRIVDKSGSANAPITIKTQTGNVGDVVIEGGSGSQKAGVEVTRSSHVHIANLKIQNTLRGIQFNSVNHGSISGNIVTNILQEGIRVGANLDNKGLAGSPSAHVSVASNLIENTGRRQGSNSQGYAYDEFGEGIYIGTGRYRGDATHDITVDDNMLRNTTAESIEIKPYTYNITVSNNTVSGSRLKYSGAISIAVGPETVQNGNYRVTGNTVFDVKSREHDIAGIVVGQGNAVIDNNQVWDIEGGRGIRVYTTFVMSGADTVRIENNTVWAPAGSGSSIALNSGNGGFGLNSPANVSTSGNVTDDGSASSRRVDEGMLLGPVWGNADNGAGPGSGLQLRP